MLVTMLKPVNIQIVNPISILLVIQSLYEVFKKKMLFFHSPIAVFSMTSHAQHGKVKVKGAGSGVGVF